MVGFFSRRCAAFGLVAISLASFLRPARADITYDIVDFPAFEDGWTISGTITTDGTLGDHVASGDILSWQWTAANAGTGASFSLQSPGTITSVTFAHNVPGDVYATDQSLSVVDAGVMLSLGNDPGTGPEFLRWKNTGATDQMTIELQRSGGETLLSWPVPTSSTFATSAAPEPSTLTLFSGVGALGLLLDWRRRKRLPAR